MLRFRIIKDCKSAQTSTKVTQATYIRHLIERQTTIGHKMEYFLATGNIKSKTGLDLMQTSGFSIMAEKINNMRFLAHFRSIHRGSFFQDMKTTSVRKLLGESWGFICPVHTPDGAPCGLLNHITKGCSLITRPAKFKKKDIIRGLTLLGMNPIPPSLPLIVPKS